MPWHNHFFTLGGGSKLKNSSARQDIQKVLSTKVKFVKSSPQLAKNCLCHYEIRDTRYSSCG
jgi:hypothetical protein